MELDFKKPLIFLAVFVGLIYAARSFVDFGGILNYVKKNPSMPAAATIDYSIGMGYFLRSDYKNAVVAFSQLMTDYPNNRYAEDGLLKLGEVDEELSDWEGARQAYSKYLEQFPNGGNRALVQGKYDNVKFKGLQ